MRSNLVKGSVVRANALGPNGGFAVSFGDVPDGVDLYKTTPLITVVGVSGAYERVTAVVTPEHRSAWVFNSHPSLAATVDIHVFWPI